MESIGQCECIYGFDQNIIVLALEEMIKMRREDLKNAQDVLNKEGADAGAARLAKSIANMMPVAISNIEIVKERVEAMPKCD